MKLEIFKVFKDVCSSDDAIKVFDMNTNRIPDKGTLVAIETSSRGLVNCVTTGNYSLRKSPVESFHQYKKDDNTFEYKTSDGKGSFLVSVEVKYCGSNSTNTRWLDELHFPVLKREER